MPKVIVDKPAGCIFFIEDDDLRKKYNTIWDKVSADIKEVSDSKPVYNKKSLENHKKILW